MFEITKTVLEKSTETEYPLLTSECELTIKDFSSFPNACTDEDIFKNFGINANIRNVFSCSQVKYYYSAILCECVENIKKSEVSEFDINFIKTDLDKPKSFKFRLTLHSISSGKDFHDLSLEERINLSENWKVSGNSLFVEGNIYMAGYWYSRSLKSLLLCCTDDMESLIKEKYKKLVGQCRINLAAVQLKNHLYDHVISNCSQALYIDSKMIKALYRRAQAYYAEGKMENAMKDLKQALKIEPKNSSIRKLITQISQNTNVTAHAV
uniref:peptidyl-prolyl cis-trans isomerase FKBP65-like n=1 Tax=Styela clava TaxID=7725 RepID=UPI00193AC036|nr:peptidyl-prolyl cis-trans isomerase FKBP65-like [Styela clava]